MTSPTVSEIPNPSDLELENALLKAELAEVRRAYHDLHKDFLDLENDYTTAVNKAIELSRKLGEKQS